MFSYSNEENSQSYIIVMFLSWSAQGQTLIVSCLNFEFEG